MGSLLAAALALAAFYAPVDASMGLAQKLVYIHIPAAMAALGASTGVFVANVAYLWSRAGVWDRVAMHGSLAVVACSLVVLCTGMLWGRSHWGMWWTWSPRLTFTLILCLLYVAYLVIRRWPGRAAGRATICAVYGCVAFLDAPLVYLSVRLMPDVHPASIPLTGEMRVTLAVWMALVALSTLGYVLRPAFTRGRSAPG